MTFQVNRQCKMLGVIVLILAAASGCKFKFDGELLINAQKNQATSGDTVSPVLAEVSALGLLRDNNQPQYTFTSTEEGVISYLGDCSSSETQALAGNNTITLNTLAWDRAYSNCQIVVTDAANNASFALNLSAFRVVKTQKLNDTGITTCGDYAVGGSGVSQNTLDCVYLGASNLALAYDDESDPVPAGQDALNGRDADTSLVKIGTGDAGFDFTKLDSVGNVLAANAAVWACVQDNVTGFVWQQASNDTFTWYDSDAASNGGSAGVQNTVTACSGYNAAVPASYCNTEAYAARINDAALCGYNDWRMPSKLELQTISDKGEMDPALDTAFFATTLASYAFWTSSSKVNGSEAIIIQANDASEYEVPKSFDHHVRLMRAP